MERRELEHHVSHQPSAQAPNRSYHHRKTRQFPFRFPYRAIFVIVGVLTLSKDHYQKMFKEQGCDHEPAPQENMNLSACTVGAHGLS